MSKSPSIKLNEGETVKIEAPAYPAGFFINIKSTYMVVTNQRVVIIPKWLGSGKGSTILTKDDILSVEKAFNWTIFNLLLPLPTCFRIRLADGSSKKFFSMRRKKFIEAINSIKG